MRRGMCACDRFSEWYVMGSSLLMGSNLWMGLCNAGSNDVNSLKVNCWLNKVTCVSGAFD